MVSARMARRANMSFHNLWLTDAGTFPVVFCASAAAITASVVGFKYLTKNPDVCISKTKRENGMHYTSEVGENWRERRFRNANVSRNAINQSRQYDPLFEKEKNKNVTR